DGEVDDAEFERCCAELKSEDAMRAWMCYHVIGDHLRGAHGMSTRFSVRFKAALAAEPTVLAPMPRQRASQPGTFAWAVAATLAAVTVVGWPATSPRNTCSPTRNIRPRWRPRVAGLTCARRPPPVPSPDLNPFADRQ